MGLGIYNLISKEIARSFKGSLPLGSGFGGDSEVRQAAPLFPF